MKEQNCVKGYNRHLTEDAITEHIYQTIENFEQEGRYHLIKKYYHHGSTTIYEHCKNVAFTSCNIAKKFHLCVDYDKMIRGALLHDYYFYDWHVKEKEHMLHGFRHPKTALKNADQDFKLSAIEKNIILCHMFPLTIVPPITMEGWIVCIADKICAVNETKEGRLRRKRDGNKTDQR